MLMNYFKRVAGTSPCSQKSIPDGFRFLQTSLISCKFPLSLHLNCSLREWSYFSRRPNRACFNLLDRHLKSNMVAVYWSLISKYQVSYLSLFLANKLGIH